MFNWNQIEKVIKDQNENSGFMNHILSTVKIKKSQTLDDEIFLVLEVPNSIVKEICQREIASKIESYVMQNYSKKLFVEYLIESSQESFPIYDSEPEVSKVNDGPREYKFEFKNKYALNQRMTFDTLIETDENKFARNALQNFSEGTEAAFECAAVFGSSGAGKTHLLHAAGWQFLAKNPSTKIKVVSGDEFINDFQTAIRSKTMGEFRNKYRLKTDVLLIDDLQTIEKAKATQGELFNLFNEFAQEGKKIIITSDKKITDLFGLDERLKSRFLGGLVLNLDLPSLPSKINFLDRKLLNLNIKLDGEMKSAVLGHLGSCYRSIEGAISRLHMLLKINGVVESDSVFKMFPKVDKKTSDLLSVESSIIQIATKHKLNKVDLVGRSRKQETCTARKEAMHFIRDNFGLSLKEIARIFNRDPSSIVSALKK